MLFNGLVMSSEFVFLAAAAAAAVVVVVDTVV